MDAKEVVVAPVAWRWKEYQGREFMPDGRIWKFATHVSTGPQDTQEALVLESAHIAALATERARYAELVAAAKSAEAFIGVMFGRADGSFPATVDTSIGIPVKLGEIMRDLDTALAAIQSHRVQAEADPAALVFLEQDAEATVYQSLSGDWVFHPTSGESYRFQTMREAIDAALAAAANNDGGGDDVR